MLFTAGALFGAGYVTGSQPILCAGVAVYPTAEFCITVEVIGTGSRVVAYAASLTVVA